MPGTTWYPLLGSMFRELLTPVGIHVDDRCPLTILTRPYLHDFLLLRRETATWSQEQYNRLPDAICDSSKKHILITFYTEESGNSLGWGIQELLAIGHFYHQSYHLAEDEMDHFLLCAETPTPSSWGNAPYPMSATNGIYKSDLAILKLITIISLEQLDATPQNAFLKTFASSQAEKTSAFAAVRRAHFSLFTHKLYWLMAGLWAHWLEEKQNMSVPPTLPEILQKGKQWQDSFLW